MSKHHETTKPYMIVFGLLIFLTVLTVVSAKMDFGFLNLPIALAIAGTKVALVMLYFMHMKDSPRLLKLFVCAAFLWVLILIGETFADYLTRPWDDRRNPEGWIVRDASDFIPKVSAEETHH